MSPSHSGSITSSISSTHSPALSSTFVAAPSHEASLPLPIADPSRKQQQLPLAQLDGVEAQRSGLEDSGAIDMVHHGSEKSRKREYVVNLPTENIFVGLHENLSAGSGVLLKRLPLRSLSAKSLQAIVLNGVRDREEIRIVSKERHVDELEAGGLPNIVIPVSDARRDLQDLNKSMLGLGFAHVQLSSPLSTLVDLSCESPIRPGTPNRRFPALLPPRLQQAYDMRCQSPKTTSFPAASVTSTRQDFANDSPVKGSHLSLIELSRGFGIEDDLSHDCAAGSQLLTAFANDAVDAESGMARNNRRLWISAKDPAENGAEGRQDRSLDGQDQTEDCDEDDLEFERMRTRESSASSESSPLTDRGIVRSDFSFPPRITRSAPLPSPSTFSSPTSSPLLIIRESLATPQKSLHPSPALSPASPSRPSLRLNTTAPISQHQYPSSCVNLVSTFSDCTPTCLTPSTNEFTRSPLLPSFSFPMTSPPSHQQQQQHYQRHHLQYQQHQQQLMFGGSLALSVPMGLANSLPIMQSNQTVANDFATFARRNTHDGSYECAFIEDQTVLIATPTITAPAAALPSSNNHVVDIAILEGLMRIEERLEEGEEKDEYMLETMVDDLSGLSKVVQESSDRILHSINHHAQTVIRQMMVERQRLEARIDPLVAMATLLHDAMEKMERMEMERREERDELQRRKGEMSVLKGRIQDQEATIMDLHANLTIASLALTSTRLQLSSERPRSITRSSSDLSSDSGHIIELIPQHSPPSTPILLSHAHATKLAASSKLSSSTAAYPTPLSKERPRSRGDRHPSAFESPIARYEGHSSQVAAVSIEEDSWW